MNQTQRDDVIDLMNENARLRSMLDEAKELMQYALSSRFYYGNALLRRKPLNDFLSKLEDVLNDHRRNHPGKRVDGAVHGL